MRLAETFGELARQHVHVRLEEHRQVLARDVDGRQLAVDVPAPSERAAAGEAHRLGGAEDDGVAAEPPGAIVALEVCEALDPAAKAGVAARSWGWPAMRFAAACSTRISRRRPLGTAQPRGRERAPARFA